MKSRNELLLIIVLIIILIIFRSLYTENKPKFNYGADEFTRKQLINLLNDPNNPTKTTVFLITPTYKRITQKADLVRLCSTLKNVKFIHWIVIEDSEATSP